MPLLSKWVKIPTFTVTELQKEEHRPWEISTALQGLSFPTWTMKLLDQMS